MLTLIVYQLAFFQVIICCFVSCLFKSVKEFVTANKICYDIFCGNLVYSLAVYTLPNMHRLNVSVRCLSLGFGFVLLLSKRGYGLVAICIHCSLRVISFQTGNLLKRLLHNRKKVNQ